MPRGDSDVNHVSPMKVDHERAAKSALDLALKDYLQTFGHERYVARLNHALAAHEAAEAIRRG